MAKDYAKQFYGSKKWKKCRKAYIEERILIDGGLCETCGRELGKIVHHKIWISPENIGNPDVTLNNSNLRYDCQTCHNREKENEQQQEKRYIFDENGMPIPISPPK